MAEREVIDTRDPNGEPNPVFATCPHVVTSDEGTSYCTLAEARPPWPEWLTSEHSAIHTAIENEMKGALEHCYSSADASGYDWTMGGLFSVAANSIMSLLRRSGCPPPAVGEVEGLPMPEGPEYYPEDFDDEPRVSAPQVTRDQVRAAVLGAYSTNPPGVVANVTDAVWALINGSNRG